jgi:ATP-dependent Lon protease
MLNFISVKLAEKIEHKMSEFYVSQELKKVNSWLNQKCGKLRENAELLKKKLNLKDTASK